MQLIRCRAYARAGLVGNPSDGYSGKTISLIVKNYFAQVVLYEWEDMELVLSQEDKSRFRSIHELAHDVQLHGYYGGIRLVKATIKKFVEYCQDRHPLHGRNFSIRYESNIPRLVGLAGSSAIIVATLRALMQFYEIEIPQVVLPSLALSVERDELGIAAGLQDRVIQVYGGLVFMDFSREHKRDGLLCGEYEALDPALLPDLYIAFSTDSSEPTERLHNDLRERFQRGDSQVVAAMKAFAGLAQQARDALVDGQPDKLPALIDANFDLRRQICALSPKHIQMVEQARQAGASAKFAGSGGAIVGTYPDEATFERLKQSLSNLHCEVIKPAM